MTPTNKIEYVFADNQIRDLVLILPGGGYARTSEREGLPVANKLVENGFHAAIYWYRNEKHLYPDIKYEGVKFLEEINNHPLVRNVYILGFSAGAHFALMLSIEKYDIIKKTVLAYPVVSNMPDFGHLSSFKNLLTTLDSPYMNELSLETKIHEKMNPVFMMHTANDESVSVLNSIELSKSLSISKIPFELHIYPNGRHGVSLATKEVTTNDLSPEEFVEKYGHLSGWFDLAVTFLKGA